MINLYCIAAFFLIFIGYLLYKLHYPANYAIMNPILDGVRGPKPWPIIGYFYFGLPNPDGLTRRIRYMAKKYGSPMYVKGGTIYCCLITKAEHAEILFSHSQNISKGVLYKFIQPFFGNGLLTSKGSEWHKQRKMLTPAFHFRILADFLPVMNEQASILCHCLKEQSEESVAFNVSPFLTRAALDTLMITAFGTDQQCQRNHDSAYANAIMEFTDCVLNRLAWPWLWPDFAWSITAQGRRSKRALDVLIGFSTAVIRERDAAYNSNNKSESDENGIKRRVAFLDLLLALKHKGQLSNKEVQEQADTFMFEGHDTTAHAMQWTVWCLASNPEAQQKARQEIIDLIGDDPNVWPSFSDLSELKWVECCVKESLRLFPSVPVIGRTTDSPICFGVNTLPSGVLLGVDFYQIQRDPKHFPDPDLYRPERFLPENSVGRHPFAFVPFAGGQRNCIGQKYAMMEMKIVCAHILRNFVLETDQTYVEEDSIYQFILRPKNGIWLKLKNRYD